MDGAEPCLYTTDPAHKKRKAWSDGLLVALEDSIVLYDSRWCRLGALVPGDAYVQARVRGPGATFAVNGTVLVQLLASASNDDELPLDELPVRGRRGWQRRRLTTLVDDTRAAEPMDEDAPVVEGERCLYSLDRPTKKHKLWTEGLLVWAVGSVTLLDFANQNRVAVDSDSAYLRARTADKRSFVLGRCATVELVGDRAVDNSFAEVPHQRPISERRAVALPEAPQRPAFSAPSALPMTDMLVDVDRLLNSQCDLEFLPRLGFLTTANRTLDEQGADGFSNAWEAAVRTSLLAPL